jgi:carbohydrate-binding DOMON domain-containing protein
MLRGAQLRGQAQNVCLAGWVTGGSVSRAVLSGLFSRVCGWMALNLAEHRTVLSPRERGAHI